MSEQQASIRVVVVTFQSRPLVAGFLGTLASAGGGRHEVVAVDNGSTDGTVELLAAAERVTVLRPGRNLGYGGAANLGATAALGPASPPGEVAPGGAAEEWVLVVNPDITFEPGCLDELISVAARWPRAGVLGPRIHTADGLLYPSARELPSLGRGVGHALFGWVWPSNPWTAAYRREVGDPVEGTVGWLSGACLLLRREAFAAVGGFDDGYFMYFEDTDLCERLARAGWQVVYAPSATVVHQGGHATSQNLEQMSLAHHRSAYRYLSARYAGPAWAPVRVVLRAGLWGRYQVSRRVGRVVHGAQPTRSASPTAR